MIVYESAKTRPLSDFHEELRFEFPNLPAQLFSYYILRCARIMAQEGNLIRRRVVIHAEPGVTRYALQAPEEMDLVGILGIRHHDMCGCVVNTVPRTFVPPDGAVRCDRRSAWYDAHEGVLHLSGPAQSKGAYYVEMSVAPALNACELPEEYLKDFFTTLMFGVRGSIMLISGRPWTNRQVGQGYYNEFLSQLHRMAIQTMSGKQRGGIKMNFGKAM